MARLAASSLAPRFGIGEWYGKSFVRLTRQERRQLAETALGHNRETDVMCPFRMPNNEGKCTKKGGVCSLRLYEPVGGGNARQITGEEGDLRAVCPHRFKQDGTIYAVVGQKILDSSSPRIVDEVRFLRRYRAEEPLGANPTEKPDEDSGTEEDLPKEDVGNIDNVVVHPDTTLLRWCALEIQAVYFSGKGMTSLFRSIRDFQGTGLPFPDAVRRPDYRSSGPKRLMPQLQIKVPTLRRWGKKMAVVVDAAFFRNLGQMETVRDLSNSDIAWFVIRYDESGPVAAIQLGEPVMQTLERAVQGLTGGVPVTLDEFESKIREKLGRR
jgi:hypothetical protein